MPSLEIIVAVDPAGGFGRQGKIPWTCKDDMAEFAKISKEIGVCAMGKKTYLDMLEMRSKKKGALKKIKKSGILPDRTCFVISSTLKPEDAPGATVVPDLRAILNKYMDTNQRIAVIGGEKMYVEALATATVVHLTVMDKHFGCDRFFPVNVLDRTFSINREQSKVVETDVDGSTATVRFIRYERSARI